MFVTDFTRTPWTQIGTNVSISANLTEAMAMAKLNFTVEKTPAYVIRHEPEEGHSLSSLGQRVDDYVSVKNEYFIRREDTGHFLGRCGKDYTPLQNVKAFEFFQPFLDSGQAVLHTAGMLAGGEKIWVLCELQSDSDDRITIGGYDEIKKFVLLVNSHNAKSAVLVGFTPIRFACTNMLSALMHDKDSQMMRIRHHKDVVKAVEEMHCHMARADVTFTNAAKGFETLAQHHYKDSKQLSEYIAQVFKIDLDKEQSTKTKNKLDAVKLCVLDGYGNTHQQIRGTWWQAYNGVTQYLNYEYGRNADSRMNALWFGASAKVGARALEVALDYCTGTVSA